MPITKVLVEHKFGIISHSQRLELQERLLKQSYIESIDNTHPQIPANKNPFEVTEEFVKLYNQAQNLDEKEKQEDTAKKMLERIKRRAGLREGCVAAHVNLPLAWTELSQLAQCKGRVQEECMDVLVTSLDQAALDKHHLPTIFFLAETMLYWLRTDVLQQPYLRAAEIKLLKMGQLVFTRLFYHHMIGELRPYMEFKNRLFTYLDGLTDCQDVYSPYPNALLSLRFIIEVGKIILLDVDTEMDVSIKGDSTVQDVKKSLDIHATLSSGTLAETVSGSENKSVSTENISVSNSVHDLSPTLWHALDVWRTTSQKSRSCAHALKALAHCGAKMANENWVDSTCAIYILAEAAKTDILALIVMQNLAMGILPEDDNIVMPNVTPDGDMDDLLYISDDDEDANDDGDDESREQRRSTIVSLSDIFERSEEGDPDAEKKGSTVSDKSVHGSGSTGESVMLKLSSSKSDEKIASDIGSGSGSSSVKDEVCDEKSDEITKLQENFEKIDITSPSSPVKSAMKDHRESKSRESREVSFDNELALNKDDIGNTEQEPKKFRSFESNFSSSVGEDMSSRLSTKLSESANVISHEISEENFPDTELVKAQIGSSGSGKRSVASTLCTFTNQPTTQILGLHGWHWEVAAAYSHTLCNICIHGNNSNIQKKALLGNNKDIACLFRYRVARIPLPSAGLLDMACFHAVKENADGSSSDWSWRVRFTALQSLVKLCKCLAKDTLREGFRNVACSALLQARSTERDLRVLEALKIGEVHTDLEALLSKELAAHPCTIGIHLATGLSNAYLPSVPRSVDQASGTRKAAPSTISPQTVITGKPAAAKNKRLVVKKPLRTTIKDEITLATSLYVAPPNYNTRTSFDLRRVIEDQWRKELQEKLEHEELERQQQLEEEYQLKEEEDKKRDKNRVQKFTKTNATV